MPPKTRGTKTTKVYKENIGVEHKTKTKGVIKVSKPRKALADKTNSASDDNASHDIPKKSLKEAAEKKLDKLDNNLRPRRDRRLPNRYAENQVLNNLSNCKEIETSKPLPIQNKTPNKNDSLVISPFKTPRKDADNSLIINRPKRVCRLPSKFDDHSVSPNKFIPVGCYASTPILHSKEKSDKTKPNEKPTSLKVVKESKVLVKKSPLENITKRSPKNVDIKSLRKNTTNSLKRDSGHLDVYEFTYDPNEEPAPQKKKRKRVVKKKQPLKPKFVIFNTSYDQNINSALAALKNVISKKPQNPKTQGTPKSPVNPEKGLQNIQKPLVNPERVPQNIQKPPVNLEKQSQNIQKPPVNPEKGLQNIQKPPVNPEKGPQNIQKPQIVIAPKASVVPNLSELQNKNHVSVGIDDIAADIEPMDHNDINYSPVTSPNHEQTPRPSSTNPSIPNYNDPLNLQEELSFFDDPPVASSSMNMSTRRPHASPWRVQFEQLPIKWQVNTYVKPNMTPAVESSFINFDDSKKKHVYTNMVAHTNEDLPEIVHNAQPNLKQTSIISFISEVVERSASKKKRARSVTPTKANSIFEDLSNLSVNTNNDTSYRTPRKTPRTEAPSISTPIGAEKAGNTDNLPNRRDEGKMSGSKKQKGSSTKDKQKDKDITFFGFDDSEDQENVSPVKKDNLKVRALRPRAKAVLQEINAQTGPTRAKVPLVAKTSTTTNSEAVNKVYEAIKSAADAPVFPEENAQNPTEVGMDGVPATDVLNEDDDSQSVHLFENIELIHHLKPNRKSYGKAAKKVTFRQISNSDSDTRTNVVPQEPESDEEDDLADLSFTMPDIQPKTKPKKKVKKKENLSKKEKAAMEAWAAGFNSMCEDIEEFPLQVE